MVSHRECERPKEAWQSDTQCRCERSEAICRSFSQNGWIASFTSFLRNDTLFIALVLLFLLSALSGCAPWVQVEGPYRMDSQGYEASLPVGWRRATTVSDSLLLTRDGVSLQYIRIERVAVGDELKHTKKKFAKRMSPQDVGEVELDEVRSDQAVRNFELVENVPFQVAGFPGFKLVYTLKTENGLRLKRVHYGVLVRDWVYRIQYQAAAKYYFDKDISTFERVRESFRLL
jgi:hypothetical protein